MSGRNWSDDKHGVELIYLRDGQGWGSRINMATVFQPLDSEGNVAPQDGTNEAGTLTEVQVTFGIRRAELGRNWEDGRWPEG